METTTTPTPGKVYQLPDRPDSPGSIKGLRFLVTDVQPDGTVTARRWIKASKRFEAKASVLGWTAQRPWDGVEVTLTTLGMKP